MCQLLVGFCRWRFKPTVTAKRFGLLPSNWSRKIMNSSEQGNFYKRCEAEVNCILIHNSWFNVVWSYIWLLRLAFWLFIARRDKLLRVAPSLSHTKVVGRKTTTKISQQTSWSIIVFRQCISAALGACFLIFGFRRNNWHLKAYYLFNFIIYLI